VIAPDWQTALGASRRFPSVCAKLTERNVELPE
jgi:hypothetical protein